MTLEDLILEAGGLGSDIFKFYVNISRIDPKKANEKIYAEEIELEIIMNTGNGSKKYYSDVMNNFKLATEINLEPYDRIQIRKDPYFRPQKLLTIQGEILYPGDYTILNSDETIKSIIDRAGGLKPNAYAEASTFKRDGKIINIDLNNYTEAKVFNRKFRLYDKDTLIVNKRPELIKIEGEVNVPGFYRYFKGDVVKDYISKAGGITPDANKKNIYVIYPNGISRRSGMFFSSKVMDGSTIKVGKKIEEEPFDRTEYFKELTSIIANLAQALSLILTSKKLKISFMYDIIIIGGGIVGLSSAYQLLKKIKPKYTYIRKRI